jgi:hypothetical protein
LKKKRKKPGGERGRDEGTYICPSCGEEIVIPLDLAAGREQEYVEDCPVCCNPNVVHVEFEEGWEEARVWAEAE